MFYALAREVVLSVVESKISSFNDDLYVNIYISMCCQRKLGLLFVLKALCYNTIYILIKLVAMQ